MTSTLSDVLSGRRSHIRTSAHSLTNPSSDASRLLSAFAIVMLLQPALFAISAFSSMTPGQLHGHVSLGPVPAHRHGYDARDGAALPAGCGPSYRDRHEQRGDTSATLVCVPSDDMANESLTSSLVMAEPPTTGTLRGYERPMPGVPTDTWSSWKTRPAVPPPQRAL